MFSCIQMVFSIITILLCLAITCGCIVVGVGVMGIRFSKVTFAMLVGYILTFHYTLVESSAFLNWLALFAIAGAVVLALSNLSLTAVAVNFFVFLTMPYLVISFVYTLTGGFLVALIKGSFTIGMTDSIVIAVISFLISFYFTATGLKNPHGTVSLPYLQAFLAAPLYGFGIGLILDRLPIDMGMPVIYTIIAVISVIALLINLYLAEELRRNPEYFACFDV